MKAIFKLLMGVGLFICLPHNAHAVLFANQFVEFELPPQWQCSLEGAEWVCQSTNETSKRDAIIVLAAKLKGDQDSIEQYLAYLKAAKTYSSVQGKSVKSDPKYAKTVNLNGQPWVDSLHLESEIPGFFTRYFATVYQDIGVLVTYSVNKAKYSQYLSHFENMVKTLKVFRKAGGINMKPQNADLFKSQQPVPPPVMNPGTVFPNVNPVGGGGEQADAKPKQQDDTTFWIIVAGGAALLFIIWKKRSSG
jgi:hypothetical protein